MTPTQDKHQFPASPTQAPRHLHSLTNNDRRQAPERAPRQSPIHPSRHNTERNSRKRPAAAVITLHHITSRPRSLPKDRAGRPSTKVSRSRFTSQFTNLRFGRGISALAAAAAAAHQTKRKESSHEYTHNQETGYHPNWTGLDSARLVSKCAEIMGAGVGFVMVIEPPPPYIDPDSPSASWPRAGGWAEKMYTSTRTRTNILRVLMDENWGST